MKKKERETKHDKQLGKASDTRFSTTLALHDWEVVDPVITRRSITHPHREGEEIVSRNYERWPGPEAWKPSSSWWENRTLHAGQTPRKRPGGGKLDLSLPALTQSYVEAVGNQSAVEIARWLGLGLQDEKRQVAEPRYVLDKLTSPGNYLVEVYGCPFTGLDAGFELWRPKSEGDSSFWVSPTTGFWGHGKELLQVWLNITSPVASRVYFEAACIPEIRPELSLEWRLAWERTHGEGYWFSPLLPWQKDGYSPRPLHPDYA